EPFPRQTAIGRTAPARKSCADSSAQIATRVLARYRTDSGRAFHLGQWHARSESDGAAHRAALSERNPRNPFHPIRRFAGPLARPLDGRTERALSRDGNRRIESALRRGCSLNLLRGTLKTRASPTPAGECRQSAAVVSPRRRIKLHCQTLNRL